MSPEEQAQLMTDMKEQFIRSVADMLALKSKLEGKKDAGKKSGSMSISPAGAGTEGAGANGASTVGDYLLDLTRLSVSFYQSVLDLNSAYFEKLTAAKAAAASSEGTPSSKKERRSKKKVLRATAAARDENVTFDVEIENKSRAAGEFRFLISDFSSGKDGGDVVRPPIRIAPARPTIAAGGKERIKIIVPVTEILKGGKKYKGRISVRGPTDAELVLRVKVEDYGDHGKT